MSYNDDIPVSIADLDEDKRKIFTAFMRGIYNDDQDAVQHGRDNHFTVDYLWGRHLGGFTNRQTDEPWLINYAKDKAKYIELDGDGKIYITEKGRKEGQTKLVF